MCGQLPPACGGRRPASAKPAGRCSSSEELTAAFARMFGSPGWSQKILSTYCIILRLPNLTHLIAPFSSVQGFGEGLRAECKTSVKGVFYQWNIPPEFQP